VEEPRHTSQSTRLEDSATSCRANYSKAIIASEAYCMWERVGTKSFTGFSILLLTLALALTFDVQLASSEFTAESGRSVVRVMPEVVELGPKNVTGQTFQIAVAVENVMFLLGLDIEFRYDPAYLDYMNHIVTAYIEEFPGPIYPSPYGGCLHEPKLVLLDDVNTEAGTYHAAMATLGGPCFNGNGTVFVMTFRVRSQPALGEDEIIKGLNFIQAGFALNTTLGWGTPLTVDGTVIIHALSLHQLTVTTSPFLTIPFTVDGESRTTPYTRVLDEDFHTIEMPGNYSRYLWSHWLRDGDTNRTKTILLDTDTTLTAVYTPLIGGATISIKSEQLSSWLASTLLVVALFSASSIYCRRKHV